MLNRTPTVYVPIEPEDNGIALPTVLSIIVHGALLALILFTNSIPTIKTPQTIETSIITPEELAEIQSAISANREALGGSDTFNNGDTATLSADSSTLDEANQSDTNFDSQASSESIFQRSSESADSFDDFSSDLDNNYNTNYIDEIQNKRLEIEQIHQRMANDIDDDSQQKHQRVEDYFSQKPDTHKQATNQQQNAFSKNNSQSGGREIPDSLKNPNKTKTGSKQTVNIDNMASGSSSGSAETHSGGTGRSSDALKGALASHIEPFWTPPAGRIGKSIKVEIRVNSNGEVLSVIANSNDEALNQSLEQAIRDASPLTPVIGSKYSVLRPTFKVTE